ncbi:MAG: adenine deaminase C-terminal domain-containing protein [Nitrosopumilus sp.]
MNSSLARSIDSLNSVALGEKKSDLILKNCNLLSVYTREIIPKIQIAIINDRIAYVGPDASHTIGSKTKIIDIKDKFVSPGFADPHLHIDQFVLPSEFAKQSLLCGVTSLFSDPIDVVSIGGYKGFQEFLKLGENLPIRIFQVVPGGLPVEATFSNPNSLTPRHDTSAITHPHVIGMGEVFSWTKVILREPKTMKSLSTMLECDCIINGHTAGASDKKLNAYVSSGILSCHEPINFDQVLERLRLGMWIMIREGSIRRDLKEIIPRVLSHGTYLNRLMFCSDGLDPLDISKFGHIDYCIRESIKLGLDPIDAVTMASKNNFDYYNMGKDLGGIAPGKLADILVFDNLKSFKPKHVFVGGKLVVSNGVFIAPMKKNIIAPWIKKTVKLKKFSKNDFLIKSKKNSVVANTIFMQNEIITKLGSSELYSKDGHVSASLDSDIWKVAAFDRIHGTNKHSIGFLENFGADIGAFASTWSFHENNLIVLGSNDSDMAIASNHLIKNQGGLVVVKSGKILASLPLQFGGIISTDSFETVSSNFEKINNTIMDLGCKFTRPHLIPLFLPFLALPSVRILAGGIVDVKKRSYISPIN